jgi:cellulose synthase/poly-beta-1,6-N-acetylglucosamine synthase-like glycosyltransferase
MFRESVIYAGIALVFSSGLLFALGNRLRRAHWLASLSAIGATAAATWKIQMVLAHATLPFASTIALYLVLGMCVTALFEHWNAAGHAAFTAVMASGAIFLAYVCYVIVTAHLGPWSLTFACLLLLLQVGTLVLLVANMFEIIDVVCRVRWKNEQGPKKVAGFAPKVSLHVPIHAEPPALVIETLDALARLHYLDYEVLVIDNNTVDEALWRPVEEHCATLGERFRFFHLLPWPGYKSGALNFALTQTASDAEIIGVVDADYVVEPEFLSDLVGHFSDPQVAFVQTPQDYRDQVSRGRYGRALYFAYQYFFDVSMATRNEYNGIIYAGTMGLIRRSALEQVGGWDEWCVTEDAEVSLRLLNCGHTSVYVPQTYGRGIMPLDYAGLKKQRFRWAFGGMQILRKHLGALLNPFSGRLTWAQRFAYINGGLQWLNDPMTLGFTAVLLIGAGALLLGQSLKSQPLTGATILMPPLFLFFAIMRFLWAFRLRARCTWREALDALVVLLGLTWVVALACVRGLVSKQGVFLRTPKQAETPTFFDTIRIVWLELILGTTCLTIAGALLRTHKLALLSTWTLTVFLLLWQSVIYFSAVRSSIWSYAEARPPRRRLWLQSFHTAGPRTGRFITEPRVAVTLVLALAVVVALFYMGRRRAPLIERVHAVDPLQQYIPAASLNQTSDPATVSAAVLVNEAEAAKRGDVEAALRLWSPQGTIVDADFKPEPAPGDKTWTGVEQVRARYVSEFAQRHYESLRHLNLNVKVSPDEIVITNDLSAVFESENTTQHIQLPRKDRWIVRRVGDDWRIVRLEVNLAPAPPGPDLAKGPLK